MAANTILLVDDDEVFLDILSDFLRLEGFEITTASNVPEALKLIISETYDVLLSDLNMPGAGDGLTVISAMRHTNPKTVTILLSASPRLGAATQALIKQSDKILLKPIDLVHLAAAIKQRIGEREGGIQQEHETKSAENTPGADYMLTVAHELRTPLTSIRGSLGLLVGGQVGTVDEKAHKLLTIALTNTERMINLINHHLDLGRFESGFATLQRQRCSFSALLRQAVEEIATTAELAHVTISVPAFGVPGEPDVFADIDPDMILQVLTNLLANAIKFSPPGSEVVIDIETSPNALVFRIIDHGRGIPEAQLESIFERFHQVELSDASHQRGTGLGLAICRAIIHQHGGTITAARNFDQGSTFIVTIPCTQRAVNNDSMM